MHTETIDLERAYRLLNHGPTVLISTTDGSVPNAAPVAWAAPASRKPARFVMTIGQRHKTYKNLIETGGCVINIPTADAIDVVMSCGRATGHEGDKLGPLRVELLPSSRVAAPRLACCVAWIEASLVSTEGAAGTSMVLLEALVAECLSGVLDAEGHFDVSTHPTLHHLGGSRFALPGRVVEHS